MCWLTVNRVWSALSQFISRLLATLKKNISECSMRQTRKSVYAAGWRNRPPSACRNSLKFITCKCINDSTIVEIAKIETFVTTAINRAHVVNSAVHWMCPVHLSTLLPNFCTFTSNNNNLRSFPLWTGKRTLYITWDKDSYIQHYCTAVANRKYIIDKINLIVSSCLFSKQLANVRICKYS
jgi:hypothetical protein